MFSENAGIVFQAKDSSVKKKVLPNAGIDFYKIGSVNPTATLTIKNQGYGNLDEH